MTDIAAIKAEAKEVRKRMFATADKIHRIYIEQLAEEVRSDTDKWDLCLAEIDRLNKVFEADRIAYRETLHRTDAHTAIRLDREIHQEMKKY